MDWSVERSFFFLHHRFSLKAPRYDTKVGRVRRRVRRVRVSVRFRIRVRVRIYG